VVVGVVAMADNPTEYSNVVKGESCNETDSSLQSPEVDSHALNMDCSSGTGGSKVSPKHSTVEGNGDVPAKLGKDVASLVKSGSTATSKSTENEVFIPAPPPATNAWTKRMQAAAAACNKSTAESASIRDKQDTAQSPSDSQKPTVAAAQKKSPAQTPSVHSADNDSQSSKLRLEGSSTLAGCTSLSAAGSSSSQSSVENTENPPSSKQIAEAKPMPGSETSSKAKVQAKSSLSSASDAVPGGCWKLPVQSASDTSVGQASFASKQLSAEVSTGEWSSFCLFVYINISVHKLTEKYTVIQ